MSLIGANCIGDFNYYLSFTIMVFLPVGILFMACLSHCGSSRVLTKQLAAMTVEEKAKQTKHALNALFELADSDHSGHVEPKELAEILRALGWSIKLKAAVALAEAIGAHADDYGHLLLTEHQFVTAMVNGEITNILDGMHINKSSHARRISSSGTTVQSKPTSPATSVVLNNSNKLVQWTLRSALVSNSLSGATQLLLLAHTPVSRKVFQYFHCHDIAGLSLLRADYDIDCSSDEYYSFMIFVLLVLLLFTVALPVVISFYLFRHRKELYSTKTYQRMGWLYDPYVRGAEFWQVHDLLMKMVLTVSCCLSWDCRGDVVGVSWGCRGTVVEMSWKCRVGNVDAL